MSWPAPGNGAGHDRARLVVDAPSIDSISHEVIARAAPAKMPTIPGCRHPLYVCASRNPRDVQATDGGRRSGDADRLARLVASDLPLQAAGSLSLSPSSPGSSPASWVARASVMRWLAALACPSMQCA